MNPFVIDKTWLDLMEFCSPEAVEREGETVFHHCFDILRAQVSPASLSNHLELSCYLEKCHEVVATELCGWAAHYSQLQWLWYLRRLPSYVFNGETSTTMGYDSQLAEVISGLVGQDGSNQARKGTSLAFEINRSIARRVLRFSHGVRFLSNIQSAFRRAGKGQPFNFPHGQIYPEFDEASPIETAISLYDDRTAKAKESLRRVGTTAINQLGSDSLRNDFEDSVLVAGKILEPLRCPSFKVSEDGVRHEIEVFGRFAPSCINLSGLKDLNQALLGAPSPIWSQQLIACIYLLRLATYLIAIGQTSFSKLVEYGYFITDWEAFERVSSGAHKWVVDFMGKVFPGARVPENAMKAAMTLTSTTGNIWPTRPGRVIRSDKGFVCIDVAGASLMLDSYLEYPKITGDIANKRSAHFEESVQNRISKTNWNPDECLVKLRGKPLKHNKAVVTDVDAFAVHKGTLIIIDCKSKVYSAEYDKGTYNVIKNTSDAIVSSVQLWNDKANFFTKFPKGDNYDFSSFPQIIGLVCTPFPVYVPVGLATEITPIGLRSACSIDELIEVLDAVPN